MRKAAWLASATAILAMTPAIAQAQTPGEQAAESSGGLEEIVVTARKRAESLQNVPVAVVAITAIQLQNNNATDFNKLAELSPQVVIGRGASGTGALLTIRGISTAPSDSGLDQSVAVNFDNVPLSRGRIIGAQMFDVQQVEVLQGPQALFFGKNSPAGVISVNTVDPTNKVEGYLTAGYEFEAKERSVEGAVGGPLSDTFKARLSFRAAKMDGYIKNIATAIANPFQPAVPLPGAVGQRTSPNERNYAGRLTLLWNPTDDFEAKFKIMYNDLKSNSPAAQGEVFCIGNTTSPVFQGRALPFTDCKKNRVKAESNIPAQFVVNYPGKPNGGVPYLRSKFTLASLNLSKEFDNLTLTSTTGYYDQHAGYVTDGDYTEFAQIMSMELEDYKMANQEIRLNSDFESPINFMVGGYYEHSSRNFDNAPNLFHIFDPVAQNYATVHQLSGNKADSYSVFGQLRWDITDTLELSGGARYSKDKKKSNFTNVQTNLASATGRSLYPQGQTLRSTFKDDNISPEATLTWKPTQGQMLYAAYKTGYKAGGISNSALLAANATPTSIQFGREQAKGFEGGYKGELMNRTLRFDLTAYRYKYTGLQVVSFDSVLVRYRVTNAASSRTTGISGSFKWLATDALSFDGNFGYNRARYLNYTGAQCYTGQTAALGCTAGQQNLSGKVLNRAPELNVMLGANYKAAIGSDWVADFSTSGSYSSSYQTEGTNGPGGVQPSFWRLNAAVHFGPEDKKFDIALIGRNLTNSYYMIYSFVHPTAGNPDQYVGIFNRPRELLVQGTVRF